MPIEIGIWKLGPKKLERVPLTGIDAESRLENSLASDLSILSPRFLLLGRQVATANGKFIDILAIDQDGNLIVIELKKDRTPRDVVAQVLDYASWVQGLSFDEIAGIYAEKHGGAKLEAGFEEAFGRSLPQEINQEHELIVVASELDPSTERIISYLSDNYGVPVNAVFFRYFRDNGAEYLARSWLIDPQEAEAKASRRPSTKGREPWNGRDFYVSFGEGETRSWDDARRYGFISGGGGKWYSQTLRALFPGARVFVNLPGRGYVGVGLVKDEVVPVREFQVEVDGKRMPILDAPLKAPEMGAHKDDTELSEYLVRVEWLRDVPREQAYWETGLFALQHTACRMTSRFTIERLTAHFGLEDS